MPIYPLATGVEERTEVCRNPPRSRRVIAISKDAGVGDELLVPRSRRTIIVGVEE